MIQDKAVKKKGAEIEVEHVLGVNNAETNEAMYFINYKEGGFAIISGDKRANPILAYSEINQLPTFTSEEIPGGLSLWINQQVRHISNLRSKKTKSPIKLHNGWQALLGKNEPDAVKSRVEEPPEDPPCEPNSVRIGPLLQTEWGQRTGYNNFAPQMGCNIPVNGRAYAGCVATAISQVMRFHEVPQLYDWNLMPDGETGGNDEISELMYDVGVEVNMDWGCNASGADDNIMDDALQNFGYSTSHQIDYENNSSADNIVVDEIDAGRPVVFSGCDKDYDLGLFPVAHSCHAWVGDGYSKYTDCPSRNTYLSFHMNWGWNGSYDGFYGYNDFTPAGQSFNYRSDVVIEIEP